MFLTARTCPFLVCFSLTGIWKKLRFVCYPWNLGGNAEQTCGVLHILFLEYHGAVQVGGMFLLPGVHTTKWLFPRSL